MKILIIGGEGNIGSHLKNHFGKTNEIITAGRNSGDLKVDLTDTHSIENLLEKTGKLDAIICAAGGAKWAPFNEISEDDFYIGLRYKLMGQVNLLRIGQYFLNDYGSITLTSGILADDPVMNTTSLAMVNGGLNSFVKAAALELPKHLRVNCVSPGLVETSAKRLGDAFPGHNPVSMKKVVNAYVRSVNGYRSGEVIKVF